MQAIDDVFYMKKYLDCWTVDGMSEHFTGEPRIIITGNHKATYPFFLRRVPGNAGLKDMVSPYGYGGPDGDAEWLPSLLEKTRKFADANSVVTEFIRHHPFLETHRHYPNAELKGQVVWVDLGKGREEIADGMEKRCRNAVTSSKRNDVQVFIERSKNSVRLFWTIYKRAMLKAGADKKYLFPLEFFFNVRSLLKKESTFLFARWKGKVIAGVLALHRGENAYYFLAGGLDKYRRLNGSSLLIHELISMMKTKGYKHLILGGGVHGKDSLYNFKRSFSQETKDFYVSKIVHDRKAYLKLCGGVSWEGFFPAYRREADHEQI